jgi:hypothetical protein
MKRLPRQHALRLVSATPATSAVVSTPTIPDDPTVPIVSGTRRDSDASDAPAGRFHLTRDLREEPSTEDNENLDGELSTSPHIESLDATAARLNAGAPTLADLIAPAAVEVARDALRIGASWARVLAITGYPRTVSPGWLDTLIGLDEPFDLSLHIHPLASGPMVRTLTRRLVQLHSSRLLDQRRGRLADPEREVAYSDVERLRDALQRGDERVFSVSLYLLARGPTRRALDERCARLVATLNNLQLSCRPATLEHDLGLTSCLPEARDRLLRYRTFDTSSLATAFPFTSSSLSMPEGLLYGVTPHNGSLVLLDPFSSELENANQVVFAKSGAGKSYACKLQILRALLRGVEAVVIDPEDEYRALAQAVGGQVARLAPGSAPGSVPESVPSFAPGSANAPVTSEIPRRPANSGCHINPFDLPSTAAAGGADTASPLDADLGAPGEDHHSTTTGDVLAEKAQALHALLDLMLADHGPGATMGPSSGGGAMGSAVAGQLTQREKGLLDRCIYETYRRVGITADPRTHTRPAPLLRDLYNTLTSGACGADESGLAERLRRYVDGSLAGLFSAPTDIQLDRPLLVFDVRELDGELRPLGLLLIAEFVWTRMRHARQPRLLLIDEAWSLLQHAEGGRFLASLARRARKYYLGLITITQDVEDFLGSEWGRTALANSSIQLLMKQDATTIEAVTRAFHLSTGERHTLLGCHKGEGLLFARGAHVALRVEASPKEHALITTDPRELAQRAAASASPASPTSPLDALAHEQMHEQMRQPETLVHAAPAPLPLESPLESPVEPPPASRQRPRRSRRRAEASDDVTPTAQPVEKAEGIYGQP